MRKISLFLLLTSLFFSVQTYACTNFLVTRGASTDGSTMISYAADSHQLFGELYFYPRAHWKTGFMLEVYEWDTGKFLGKIEQPQLTYQVTGNMNEYQVAIGETTFGGINSINAKQHKTYQHQDGAVVDYGSLIYIALQRAKTAREAIQVMGDLVAKYGYYSSGESFSISDPNEVWILEMVGKGNAEKGAVWVAMKIPDGYISAHANQARIMTFPFQKKNDFSNLKQEVYHSADVISFARKQKLFSGKDKDFSFSDVYAPVDFGGARFCEIRVWSFFKSVNQEVRENKAYWNYSKGDVKHEAKFADGTKSSNHFASNRMPLWVKPDHKISVHDVMNFMRDHLENTELDMSKDIGAGQFANPYRWRGLTWKYKGQTYCNERATATQQTGFSFVAQARNWLPNPVGGIFWFGVDDAASSVYMPIGCAIKDAPSTLRHGNGSMIKWSENSAFWVFNQVSNWAYTRYDTIHAEIHEVQQALEKYYIRERKAIDKTAAELYKKDPQLAVDFVSEHSTNTANSLTYRWKEFYTYLFMKYMDGNIKKARNHRLLDNGQGKDIPMYPDQPGYGEAWYKRIVDETGDKFLMPEGAH